MNHVDKTRFVDNVLVNCLLYREANRHEIAYDYMHCRQDSLAIITSKIAFSFLGICHIYV